MGDLPTPVLGLIKFFVMSVPLGPVLMDLVLTVLVSVLLLTLLPGDDIVRNHGLGSAWVLKFELDVFIAHARDLLFEMGFIIIIY